MSLVGTRPILQDELLKYELHHRANVTFLISVPCCCGIILVADQIVEVLFGVEFLPAISTIRILSILIVLMPF